MSAMHSLHELAFGVLALVVLCSAWFGVLAWKLAANTESAPSSDGASNDCGGCGAGCGRVAVASHQRAPRRPHSEENT